MKTPCDEISMTSGTPCTAKAGPWILAATILASSMAFIDGTIVNVAAPRFQSAFHATVIDVQWMIESYGLFLSSLILVGGALGDWLGRRAVFCCTRFGRVAGRLGVLAKAESWRGIARHKGGRGRA